MKNNKLTWFEVIRIKEVYKTLANYKKALLKKQREANVYYEDELRRVVNTEMED